MTNADYHQFSKALNDLACGYCRKLEPEELAEYFRQLSRFSIETVLAAISMAPEESPQYFPAVGILLTICQRTIIDHRGTADSVDAIKSMAQCRHKYVFELEEPGGLYIGFDVCVHCGFAKPKLNRAAPPIQLDYFRMAIDPKGRSDV